MSEPQNRISLDLLFGSQGRAMLSKNEAIRTGEAIFKGTTKLNSNVPLGLIPIAAIGKMALKKQEQTKNPVQQEAVNRVTDDQIPLKLSKKSAISSTPTNCIKIVSSEQSQRSDSNQQHSKKLINNQTTVHQTQTITTPRNVKPKGCNSSGSRNNSKPLLSNFNSYSIDNDFEGRVADKVYAGSKFVDSPPVKSIPLPPNIWLDDISRSKPSTPSNQKTINNVEVKIGSPVGPSKSSCIYNNSLSPESVQKQKGVRIHPLQLIASSAEL